MVKTSQGQKLLVSYREGLCPAVDQLMAENDDDDMVLISSACSFLLTYPAVFLHSRGGFVPGPHQKWLAALCVVGNLSIRPTDVICI